MKLITRFRAGMDRLRTTIKAIPAMLQGVDGRAQGMWHTLFDSDLNLGDWQKDIKIDRDSVMANWAIFSCITLIAADIGKVSLDLVELKDGIEIDAYSPAFSPVIRKPNPFQTRQQFMESWVTSKLSFGNAYILKVRDSRGGVVGGGVVVRHYVLDACRVTPLVAPSGAVYYRLGPDPLSEITFEDGDVYVPASEIIHDRMNCLFHPLVGLSPIFASGLAATQGLKIQQNSAQFFTNMSRPSGILTAPGQISDETAARLKKHWDENFSGDKIGKLAVLGDDLKYQAMTITAVDAQLTEQLKLSAEMICSTFHVPAFKIGAGTLPLGQKVEDLNQIYYSDCLHALMDAIQTLLVEGLGLDTPKDGTTYAVRFNLDDLLKMDTTTFIASLKTAVDASLMAPNEGRRRINLPPVPGGNAPLSQQQNYSLEALAKRDAQANPFATAPAPAPALPAPGKGLDDASLAREVQALQAAIQRDVGAAVGGLSERVDRSDDMVRQTLEAVKALAERADVSAAKVLEQEAKRADEESLRVKVRAEIEQERAALDAETDRLAEVARAAEETRLAKDAAAISERRVAELARRLIAKFTVVTTKSDA